MSITPRLWEIYADGDTIVVKTEDKTKSVVAFVTGMKVHPEMTKANACLIAAAPEMEALLREAWLEMDNALQTYIPEGEDGEDMASLCWRIDALLGRIEGEQAS